MTSNITLYSKVEFTKDQNMTLDEIETYLSSINDAYKISISSANYFKHKLQTTLTLDLGQTALNFTAVNYNYARIYNITENSTAEKYTYYFVESMKWRSKNVVELELTMDSVTTIGTSVRLTRKTLIHRQHLNRYNYYGGYIHALINKTPEGLNPILYKDNENILKPSRVPYASKWYIVYRNKNIPSTDYNEINPVQILIMPEHKTTIYNGELLQELGNGNVFSYYSYYNVSSYANGNMSVALYDASQTTLTTLKCYSELPTLSDGSNAAMVYYYVRIHNSPLEIDAYYYRAVLNSNNEEISRTLEQVISLTAANSFVRVYGPSFVHFYKATQSSDNPGAIYTANKNITGGTIDIEGLDYIDRTDSKLIKIVELPYCPLKIYKTAFASGLAFDKTFNMVLEKDADLNEYYMIAGNPDDKYITSEIETDMQGFVECDDMYLQPNNLSKTAVPNSAYETKLYSSEFFQRKFIYDSFTYTFKYEECNINSVAQFMQNNNFTFIFNVSNAITSKFNFDFSPSWTCSEETEDYPALLNVARNNEIPIFTSQYINYLRTGLQYDLKNKERQTAANIGSIILSTAGTVAGAALGVISGNAAVGVAGVISGATALTSSIASAVNQSITAQQNLEQKQAQLKAQNVTVQASDDLPLLHAYSKGNWAKIALYKPSLTMTSCIHKLFFYTGYNCEYMDVPALDTRLRFNYIQAEIDIDRTEANAYLLNYPSEVIENYKARFSAGLTIIHYYDGIWDIAQNYENWESILRNVLIN